MGYFKLSKGGEGAGEYSGRDQRPPPQCTHMKALYSRISLKSQPQNVFFFFPLGSQFHVTCIIDVITNRKRKKRHLFFTRVNGKLYLRLAL